MSSETNETSEIKEIKELRDTREIRRAQLIGAALELAMSEGASAVKVGAVAARAGLARSSVYEYFASSADLVADLVLEELSTYRQALAGAASREIEPIEQIMAWLQAAMEYVADGRHLLIKSLNTVDAPALRRSEIVAGHRALLSPLYTAMNSMGITDPTLALRFLQGISDAAAAEIESGGDWQAISAQLLPFARAGLQALATLKR